MTEVKTNVKCPGCGVDIDVTVDALACSGMVPVNKEFCFICGTAFTVSATVDVEVKDVTK